MIKLSRNKWIVIIALASVLALFPIIVTAFELISTEKDSVIFLENYPTSVTILILLYYVFLVLLGVYWFVKQLIAFFSLKNEKEKNELLHLKSQVSPHFFFNMLNNLYGLVEKDSKKAKELILKLSDMMRYSIYEGEKEFVSVEEEIDFLENYIELHKMRYHKKINVKLNSQIDENYKIMPLLFIILVENSFKHGVENLRENAFVDINISSVEDKIRFRIENNFDNADFSDKKEHTGIGLKNLKRRLELGYKNKYDLSFSTTENIYKVELTLNKI